MVKWGEVLQSSAKRCRLAEPFLHRFWPGKIEYLAGTRLRVTAIREPRHDAGAFVDKGQRFLIVKPFELRRRVPAGLFLDCRDFLAPVFGFGLDHADRLLVDEEYVVDGTDIRLVLANSDSQSRAEIYFVLRLYFPTRLLKLPRV